MTRMPRNEGSLALKTQTRRHTERRSMMPAREAEERYVMPEAERQRDVRLVTHRYDARKNAPPARRQKPQFRIKAKHIICALLAFIALFAVAMRQIQIDGQILELDKMRKTLKDEQKRGEDLSLDLAMKLDIEKAQAVAHGELGMDYPEQGQIKAIVIPPIQNESTPVYAVNSAPLPNESRAAKDGIAGFFDSLMESLR